LRLNPNHADAHYNLGILFAKEGKINDASVHLQSALQTEPNSKKFRQALDELPPTGCHEQ
jgi:TolA-binding protein